MGFSDTFSASLSKISVLGSQPVVEQVEQYDYEFAWEIPLLNTKEKTGYKIYSGLSKAVIAAMSVKSNQESIKMIEKKYNRPENCDNLCRVNGD